MKSDHPANRLIDETSPYLLQHAHNPVDWYPWGEEAFDKARAEKKPILLSIGYSACHWCHVMAHESFENEEISRIMNATFVNIKVDREERPDLDRVYQTIVQFFIKRAGGWPLTVFLTPEKVPFYGGTYFPPVDRFQLPGFPKLLEILAETYRTKPEDIADTVQNVRNSLGEIRDKESNRKKKEIDPALLEKAVTSIEGIFDTKYGGFGGAPKFPGTSVLNLLLRFHRQSEQKQFLQMVTYTLSKMAWGGIYDQLGGGFHRYSVDERWLVPHFEKMLYDNAQLATLYFSTFQATGDDFYKTVGIEILDYVIRDMTDPEGGFYSSQDADSEGGEGLFYLWTPQQILDIIGEESASLFCPYYNISEAGNFEGKNIPHLTRSIDRLAEETGREAAEAIKTIHSSKERLLREREKRPKPFRDEKIITSWASMMISAFVLGYQVTRNKVYLDTAIKGAGFIRTYLYEQDNLLHTFKDGIGKLKGYLDDYSFFIDALLDLYEASTETSYLDDAELLANRLVERFLDDVKGGFYFTSIQHEALIDRSKPVFDQSIPSGNAIASQVFQRLFYLTGKQSFFEIGELTLKYFSTQIEENPFGTGHMIAAADLYLRRPKEIRVVGDRGSPEIERILSEIYKHYLPNKVVVFNDMGRDQGLDRKEWKMVDGKPTVYICRNFTCSQPLTSLDALRTHLLA